MTTEFTRPTIVIACTAIGLWHKPFWWWQDFLGTCTITVYQTFPSLIGIRSLDVFALPYTAALLANASTLFLRIGWSIIIVVSFCSRLYLAYLDKKTQLRASLSVHRAK